MKTKLLSLLTIISFFFLSFAFTYQSFPSVNLKSLSGQVVNTDEFVKNGKLTVVSFWATWCSPCKRELDAIADIYEDWQEAYDVELIAITIDNSRQLNKVPGMVASKNWNYIVLSDTNQELQNALNFETIPQTFLLDRNGYIVYSHNGYTPGDEYELEDEIKKHM